MTAIDDGRDLFTFDADHTTALNNTPCEGHGYIAGERGSVPPPHVASFPGICTGCARANLPMKYLGQHTQLYKFYCLKCP